VERVYDKPTFCAAINIVNNVCRMNVLVACILIVLALHVSVLNYMAAYSSYKNGLNRSGIPLICGILLLLAGLTIGVPLSVKYFIIVIIDPLSFIAYAYMLQAIGKSRR